MSTEEYKAMARRTQRDWWRPPPYRQTALRIWNPRPASNDGDIALRDRHHDTITRARGQPRGDRCPKRLEIGGPVAMRAACHTVSLTGRCGGFRNDVDDTQAELPLSPVHQVQLQPA